MMIMKIMKMMIWNSVDSGFETYTWDTFFLAPMDAGCLAFIVQTKDVRFMVKTMARLAHSPQSTYRANRRYLYLPSRRISDNAFETIIKEMFPTREMDFMPDLVIAKLTEIEVTSESSCSTVLCTGECKTSFIIKYPSANMNN
jgi:hypothetical protein